MMRLDLRISPAEGKPIYRQLVEQISYLVASGRLQAGERLPAVRRLAEQLVINPNTVARAYRQLEAAGAVTARSGSGVFVSDAGSPLSVEHKHRVLAERIDRLLSEACQLDIDDEDLLRLIAQRVELLATGTGS